MRVPYLVILLLLIATCFSYPQDMSEKSFYGGLFHLTEYINSEKFYALKKNNTDLQLVDSIYTQALIFFNGDISESLLCLTFACLPFNIIQFKLPFSIGILKIPLPSPSSKLFEKKVANLPERLFFDSPNDSFGDKDKLSHFFGNAFLRFSIPIFNVSKFMGIFVEKTEENFFANGGFSNKDIIANHLGEIFAQMLKLNSEAKPSEAFLVYQLLFFRNMK